MTAVHLAGPEDAERLRPMIAACHDEMQIADDTTTRDAALMPLLSGSPHGAIYLIGPARAPIGYIVISFGWSLAFGGLVGVVEEVWIRAGVRGRGIASEVLNSLPKALAVAGLRALHLEVHRDDTRAQDIYRRQKFTARPDYVLMTQKF
ncbi:GNAT family N-acetyltransferase [Pseudooceanicola sp.]|uniref:GNAT family N-acetyltransferase n=1 Tax=Pseudooceanicola sp. TaxID=1914328 RepID=UPI0026114B32|nr:GNAT family N-acetyltransferase [Pseudooceanicola sp.]MDF1854147.1 GNAT family N-acetyltransferase [Pseudooceanicola sp.]